MNWDIIRSNLGKFQINSNGNGIVSISNIEAMHVSDSRPDELTELCKRELELYFLGRLEEFSVPVDISYASAFYQLVWKELLNIGYGQTRSYSEVAKAIHKPKAVRAVGLANGKNPVPILIPCHRVIGADGSLVGYGMGLDLKKQLLMLENPEAFGIQGKLF